MKRPLELIRAVWVSCAHAGRGILFAARAQRNFRLHLLAAVSVLALAVAFHFGRLEMILVILTVSLVILGELLNTALEYTLNLLEAHHHPVVRTAKDIAAGGVLLCVLGSIGVGILLFGPRICALLMRIRG